MSNAPRPTTARKVTRSSETKRKSALDEGVRISVGDSVYEVRIGDINALHSRALREQAGMSFTRLMDLMNTDPDLDVIAAVVWLARRMKGEGSLAYDDVAAEIGFDFLEQAEITETATEKVGDDPEA